jgi:hypothetical protein
MVEKSITGSGTYSRNSVAWDAVALFERCETTLKTMQYGRDEDM